MSRDLLKEVMERAAADQSQRQIARETGTPRVTVQRALAVMQCEVNELRQFQRDAFMTGWQTMYLDTLREFYERSEAGTLTPTGRKDLAITMGISSEKALLLAGQPTSIVAGIHEVRIDLPGLAARLADVSRAVGRQGVLPARSA